MRLSVIHLRILMILVNLGISAGMGYFYVEKMMTGDDSESSAVKIHDPGSMIRKVPGRSSVGADARLQLVQDWLNPKKKIIAPPIVPDKNDEEEDDEVDEDIPTQEGPLAESWEYVWCILDQDNELSTLVMLKKLSKKTKTTSSLRRTASYRGRSSTTKRSSSKRPSTTRLNPDDLLFFRIGDRHFGDEDLDLDFYMISADFERFVYAVPGRVNQPPRRYALKRKARTWIDTQEDKTIIEIAKTPVDGEEEEEKEKSKFVIVPQDFEDRREIEYASVMKGKSPDNERLPSVQSRKIGGGSRRTLNRARPTPGSVRSRTTSTSGSKKSASKSAARGGPYTDPEQKKKALKELSKTTKNLSPEVQKEIRDALTKPQPK